MIRRHLGSDASGFVKAVGPSPWHFSFGDDEVKRSPHNSFLFFFFFSTKTFKNIKHEISPRICQQTTQLVRKDLYLTLNTDTHLHTCCLYLPSNGVLTFDVMLGDLHLTVPCRTFERWLLRMPRSRCSRSKC